MTFKDIKKEDIDIIKGFMKDKFLERLIPIKYINGSKKNYQLDRRTNRPEKENIYIHPASRKIMTMKEWKILLNELFNYQQIKEDDIIFL